MKSFRLATCVLALSCFGLLAVSGGLMSGCKLGKKAEKTQESVKMQVEEVDQLAQLGDKVPDGQYMVAKVVFQNPTNKTIVLKPTDFSLGNITTNVKDQYSQPTEKMMSQAYAKQYGKAFRDKVMDSTPANLYPRLQLERYFVFMVPGDAKPEQYQITYIPAKTSVPLVTSATTINDHRNDLPLQ